MAEIIKFLRSITMTNIHLHDFGSTKLICNNYYDLFQLAGPISIGETYDTTLIKYSRKEFSNLLSSDQEKPEDHQSSGLRHRRAQLRSYIAAPPSTSVAESPTSTTVTWEDQQPQHARSAKIIDIFVVTVSLAIDCFY